MVGAYCASKLLLRLFTVLVALVASRHLVLLGTKGLELVLWRYLGRTRGWRSRRWRIEVQVQISAVEIGWKIARVCCSAMGRRGPEPEGVHRSRMESDACKHIWVQAMC
jgi:hypothetical protein